MKKLLLVFLLGSLSLFGSVIGHIVKYKGDVRVLRSIDNNLTNIETISVEQGKFPIQVNDIVITKQKSRAFIEFNDKTVINLGRESEFIIKDYLYDEAKKEASSEFEIPKGAFKAITGGIGKINPDKFKIKTRTSTIGIRGTELVGVIGATKESIACTKGAIFTASNGVTVDIPAGFLTEIAMGQAPITPRVFTALELAGLLGFLSISGEDDEKPVEKTPPLLKTNENNVSQENNITVPPKVEEKKEAPKELLYKYWE
ncbi:MAG: FecR family protein [Campylobacterales bacterium]|nr:FecR family protein [Campylobacterales bacterium]